VDHLDGILWRMAEKVADRAKATEKAGRVVTLKLKRADFRLITRRVSLLDPTQLADAIYGAARPMLDAEMKAAPFRLLGVGLSEIVKEEAVRQIGSLLDPDQARREQVERATDSIRDKFGSDAILKGRALKS